MNSKDKTKAVTTCFACGEDVLSTANYRLKILPAKRIPKMIAKLKKKCDTSASFLGKQRNKKDKLLKYIARRSVPTNIMEVICGVCKSVSKINMRKVGKIIEKSPKDSGRGSNSSHTKPKALSRSQKKKKRKSNTPKDLTAGLFIPESMRSNKNQNQNTNSTISTLETPTSVAPKVSQAAQLSNPEPSSKSDGIIFPKRRKKITTSQESISQKQVHNLRKTLFKSKNFVDSSNSLKDFLS